MYLSRRDGPDLIFDRIQARNPATAPEGRITDIRHNLISAAGQIPGCLEIEVRIPLRTSRSPLNLFGGEGEGHTLDLYLKKKVC